LALGASCGGDDGKCSKIGCYDTFTVGFTGGSWVDGAYSVMVTVDGDEFECVFELPLEDAPRSVCQPNSPVELWAYRDEVTDPFLPAGVVVLGTPEEVSVVLSHEGEVLASDDYEVSDDRIFPNGEECDKGCLNAKASLSLGGQGGAGGGAGAAGD
jgi:hypothetical protein